MNWNFLRSLFSKKKIEIMAYGRTDTGLKRPRNEDSFAILTNQNLFIVADGMGGHKAGDIASQNAVNVLAEYLLDQNIKKMAGNQAAIRHAMVRGFIHTNDTIIQMASEQPDYKGMGCTMIACYIDGSFIHLCHVGDVRGYLSIDDTITQLTNDHSFAAEYEREVNKNSSAAVPKNIISRAIGFPFKEHPDYNYAAYKSGSKVILCSDGLWGMLEDDEINKIANNALSPAQACDRYIEKANEAGGRDNITAISIFLQ